jgi:hypothetical protein
MSCPTCGWIGVYRHVCPTDDCLTFGSEMAMVKPGTLCTWTVRVFEPITVRYVRPCSYHADFADVTGIDGGCKGVTLTVALKDLRAPE